MLSAEELLLANTDGTPKAAVSCKTSPATFRVGEDFCYLCFMSRNYKFHNLEGVYYVSFAVVECLPAASRD